MKHLSILFLILFTTFATAAQPPRLTEAQVGEKGNLLLNAGKQREALDLVDSYPEFENSAEALYIRSVAYAELRDYKKADLYFARQFNVLRANADMVRLDADETMKKQPMSKMDTELALLSLETAMVSYAAADMSNSLRAVVFEKNGMPASIRVPKNLPNYDEMLVDYRKVAITVSTIQLKANMLNEALKNANKAVQIGGASADAYIARAQVYRRLKKLALARADELKAAKLNKK